MTFSNETKAGQIQVGDTTILRGGRIGTITNIRETKSRLHITMEYDYISENGEVTPQKCIYHYSPNTKMFS